MARPVVAIIGPGSVFLRGARAALRTRSPHLDLPIALALVAGGIWGIVNTFTGTGEVYFDSLTALVFLLLVGRYIQLRQQRAAADAVVLLHAFTPSTAHLLTDDALRDVPVEALRVGDTVRVRAGERIPADARIESGASTLDASLLTGESKPAKVETGDPVAAGAVNLTAPLTLLIEATGTETRVGRLMNLGAAAADAVFCFSAAALACSPVPKFISLALIPLRLSTAFTPVTMVSNSVRNLPSVPA